MSWPRADEPPSARSETANNAAMTDPMTPPSIRQNCAPVSPLPTHHSRLTHSLRNLELHREIHMHRHFARRCARQGIILAAAHPRPVIIDNSLRVAARAFL